MDDWIDGCRGLVDYWMNGWVDVRGLVDVRSGQKSGDSGQGEGVGPGRRGRRSGDRDHRFESKTEGSPWDLLAKT